MPSILNIKQNIFWQKIENGVFVGNYFLDRDTETQTHRHIETGRGTIRGKYRDMESSRHCEGDPTTPPARYGPGCLGLIFMNMPANLIILSVQEYQCRLCLTYLSLCSAIISVSRSVPTSLV